MDNPLSMDLRPRGIAAVDYGLSRCAAAAHFRVTPSTAIRWEDEQRRNGTLAPKPQGGDTRLLRIETRAGLIHAALEENPAMTRAEMCGHPALHGVNTYELPRVVSQSSLKRVGFKSQVSNINSIT